MKLITVDSKKIVNNKKWYIQTYTINITERYEQDIKSILNTATIFDPQVLFKILKDQYESNLISISRKKV
jgi:hypothetical protein